MHYKIRRWSIVAVCFQCLFCGEENNPVPGGQRDSTHTIESYGVFRVTLVPENIVLGSLPYTQISGMMNDGPSPPEIIFEETMKEGNCRLLKTIYPLCNPSCGSNAKCVKKDSCMEYPNNFSVGEVTLKGFKKNGSDTTFKLSPRTGSIGTYYQMAGIKLDYPPFTEGDTITFAPAGSASASPFTLQARAISPLKMITTTAILEDGKPITLKWEKSSIEGISRIHVRVNISYHGGTKGEIQCDCEDNGEIVIPARLLDELKTYGIAGYPVADVTRRSVGTNENAKAQLIIESTVTVELTYPDKQSCTGHEDCPEGYHCTDYRLCEPD